MKILIIMLLFCGTAHAGEISAELTTGRSSSATVGYQLDKISIAAGWSHSKDTYNGYDVTINRPLLRLSHKVFSWKKLGVNINGGGGYSWHKHHATEKSYTQEVVLVETANSWGAPKINVTMPPGSSDVSPPISPPDINFNNWDMPELEIINTPNPKLNNSWYYSVGFVAEYRVFKRLAIIGTLDHRGHGENHNTEYSGGLKLSY